MADPVQARRELSRLFAEAHEWLCECGERPNSLSAQWRWNGEAWEHYHGYPIGHVQATRKPDNG